MLNSLIVACALIGMPTMVLADADTAEVIDSSTEVVEETSSEEDVFEIVDEVTDEDFDLGEWINEKFSGQTIALIVTVIGLVASCIKLMNNGRDAVTGAINSVKKMDAHTTTTVDTAVNNQILTKIVPIVEENSKLTQSTMNSIELLCKLVVASQDQTATGKEYFANLTQSMGSIFTESKDFAEKVSANLKVIIESTKESKEAVTNKLQDIINDIDLPVE